MYPIFRIVKASAIYVRLCTVVPMYQFLPPKIFNPPHHDLSSGISPQSAQLFLHQTLVAPPQDHIEQL